MSESEKPPVLWSTLITRWAVVALLAVGIVIAMRPNVTKWFGPARKFHTTGDAADIRLIAVVPDGGDDLFDPEGRPLGGAILQWPGQRTYTWSAGMMQRDFLFELGSGATNLDFPTPNPGSIEVPVQRAWLNAATLELGPERVPANGGPVSGGPRLLLRATLSENYWKSSFIGFNSHQPPLEVVDVTLSYFPPGRTKAQVEFDGPFLPGRTNAPRQKLSVNLTALSDAPADAAAGAEFRAWGPWPSSGQHYMSMPAFAYDVAGRRHHGRMVNSSTVAGGWTNSFQFRGLPLGHITAITFGEQPRAKKFHHVVVQYPGRTNASHARVLDRLAAALGKTNVSPSNLEHYSPRTAREALLMLEFMPRHRNALQALAYNIATTNYQELPPDQREFLRRTARDCAARRDSETDPYALRIGLRGGWPEFLLMALDRLTNGTSSDRLTAAQSLGTANVRLETTHVPLLLALVRSNDPPRAAYELIQLLARIRDAAATNALLELARADAPGVWWPALVRLHRTTFQPFAALPEEMQQRVILAKDFTNAPVAESVRATAFARLPGLLTHDLRRDAPEVFHEIFRRLAARAPRPTALAAMTQYLRSVPSDHWRSDHPSEIIRQINAWHGKDFGGLGDGRKGGSQYPSSDAWPGLVEDVIEFCDQQQKLEGPAR